MPGPETGALSVPLPNRRTSRRLGLALGRALRPGDTVLLEGELGAGKTFLVRAIARALGVPESQPIQSPTFALVHDYALPGGGRLVHADLYRIDALAELRDLDLDEDDRAIRCIEWPRSFARQLMPDHLLVALTQPPRTATLTARGAGGSALLLRVANALATPAVAR